jgi:opacity protein-like surface antigen
MKRILLAAVALSVAAAVPVPSLEAQMIIPFLGGGFAKWLSDLSEDTDIGWIGFGGVDYTIASVPGLSVGAVASYTHIPYSGDGGDATNIPALFGELGYTVGATTANMIKPYIRGGVGIMQHRYDPGDLPVDDESETKAGVSIGAGLNFVMQSVSPFIGAHFITGGSDTSFFAVYGGIAFGGSGGHTMTFRRR